MTRWFACAVAGPVVRRALGCACVVGPLLVAINHGDAIVAGEITAGRIIRIALTLLVPYAVSTFSSVQTVISRVSPSETGGGGAELDDG